jgi:hypothetical protein
VYRGLIILYIRYDYDDDDHDDDGGGGGADVVYI